MAKEYIDFNSNTKKVPHQIKGTDLYYFQVQVGVEQNGYDRFMDYLSRKIQAEYGEEEVSGRQSRKLRENAWIIYKKENEKQSYEDFVEDINAGRIHKIGDLLFTPVNQNMELDTNGNLLLKTLGSDLDDYNNRGDILLSADGTILRNTRGSMAIRSVNEYGYYPVDVFVSQTSKETGAKEIVDIEHNFLDPFGKLITKENYVRPRKTEDEYVMPITRTFFVQDEKGQIRNDNIYPTGYIYADKNEVMFFPSAIDVLASDKKRVEQGLPELCNDKGSLIAQINERYEDLDDVTSYFGMKYDRGEISDSNYSKVMGLLNDEYEKIENYFANNPDSKIDHITITM